MAYREGRKDVRTSGLIAVVATRERLLDERRRNQLEHDELAEEVDTLDRRLAGLERARERRGVIAALKRWSGIAHPAALQREADAVRVALAARAEQLARIALREQTFAARLADVEAARVELAGLEAAQVASLRAAGEPAGDELRRLGEALGQADERIAALVRAGATADRGGRAIDELRGILGGSSLGGTAAQVDAAPSFERLGANDRERARARLREQLGLACGELRAFRDAFASCQLEVDAPARLALGQLVAVIAAPTVEPPESSELVTGLESTAVCVARLVAAMNEQLVELRRRREALVAQQLAIAGRPGAR